MNSVTHSRFPPILQCPSCRSLLPPAGRCACGANYSLGGGAFDFIGESDYYWGELTREEMRRLVDSARVEGWRKAVRALVYPERPDLEAYFEDPRRTAWLAEVPLTGRATVADLGAGWGTIGFQLAAAGAWVCLVEAVRERVELLRVRAEQDGLTTATVVRASFIDVPLAPGAFDLVVLNGVLEWAGIADLEGTPRQAQLRLLQKAREAVRPGGFVYVGIENRFGWPQLRGEIDHSGLPFTSLLPRALASLVVRFSTNPLSRRTGGEAPRQTAYRTYTYTLAGYTRLFAQAGLHLRRPLLLAPSYNLPKLIAPLDHSPTLGAATRAALTVMRSRAGPVGWLARRLAALPSPLLAAAARAFAPTFGFVLERPV